MQVPFTAVHGSVRFSLSRYNTEADVDRISEVFPSSTARLEAPFLAGGDVTRVLRAVAETLDCPIPPFVLSCDEKC
jgi:hypothetical protein